MEVVTNASNKATQDYGIAVADVRIRRVDLPAENEESISEESSLEESKTVSVETGWQPQHIILKSKRYHHNARCCYWYWMQRESDANQRKAKRKKKVQK